MHVSLLKGILCLICIYDVFYETAMFMETALMEDHLTFIALVSEDDVVLNSIFIFMVHITALLIVWTI